MCQGSIITYNHDKITYPENSFQNIDLEEC